MGGKKKGQTKQNKTEGKALAEVKSRFCYRETAAKVSGQFDLFFQNWKQKRNILKLKKKQDLFGISNDGMINVIEGCSDDGHSASVL